MPPDGLLASSPLHLKRNLIKSKLQITKAVCKPLELAAKFPFDPKEPRECWAIFLALHMQIESKLGTANSLNLEAFNTPYVVPTSWIISCRRQVLYNKASYSLASNFAHAASV